MRAIALFNVAVERLLLWLFSALFGLMVLDVLLQVVSRNLGVAVLWTLDAAQLLFAWCIFLGAAVGVRRGGHYVITLLPDRMVRANAVLKLFADAVVATVAGVMLLHGFEFAGMGFSSDSESLPLSQFWNYLPIPLCGGFILLFLVEVVAADLRDLATARNGTSAS